MTQPNHCNIPKCSQAARLFRSTEIAKRGSVAALPAVRWLRSAQKTDQRYGDPTLKKPQCLFIRAHLRHPRFENPAHRDVSALGGPFSRTSLPRRRRATSFHCRLP